jgi:hypothetical protein
MKTPQETAADMVATLRAATDEPFVINFWRGYYDPASFWVSIEGNGESKMKDRRVQHLATHCFESQEQQLECAKELQKLQQ